MKKFYAITLTALLAFSTWNVNAYAETDLQAEVYVTVSDKDGALVLTQETVTVTDTDNDGALTIHDALYAAHEANYTGGATEGYASSMGSYGLQLDKLWGIANGGSYGYYVNNQSAWSLTDSIQEGDYVNAFIYTDLTAWSDTYCYFDVMSASGKVGEELTFTLSMAGYDAMYNPIAVPVEGAVITVNNEETEYTTDKDGKVTIKIETEGAYVISAVSDTLTLVPPVCKTIIIASDETENIEETESTEETENIEETESTEETENIEETESTEETENIEETETTEISEQETTKSSESETTEMNKQETTSPQTGDNTDAFGWMMLFVVSISGIMILLVKDKKSYEK